MKLEENLQEIKKKQKQKKQKENGYSNGMEKQNKNKQKIDISVQVGKLNKNFTWIAEWLMYWIFNVSFTKRSDK